MKERLVHVPRDERPTLKLGVGADVVHYIDKNLGIRTWHLYEGVRSFKVFPVEPVSDEMFEHLLRCLEDGDPGAEEIMHFKWEDGRFFLCVVRYLGR